LGEQVYSPAGHRAASVLGTIRSGGGLSMLFGQDIVRSTTWKPAPTSTGSGSHTQC